MSWALIRWNFSLLVSKEREVNSTLQEKLALIWIELMQDNALPAEQVARALMHSM